MSTPPTKSDESHDRDADLSIDPEWTTRILTDFISTELQRTGFRRLVIGLSGGIASALAAMLAARAIGPEAVLGIRFPRWWIRWRKARRRSHRCAWAT